MKALITGAGGLLGRELSAALPTALALDHAALDVTDEDRVWKALTSRQLDVVFHCAAFTNVDACEKEPATARRVNALGARNVAAVCGSLSIYLVALSTDYVLDGKPGQELREDSAPKPISVYGKTKLEGEIAVQEQAPRHAIVRTSWLYGHSSETFVERIISRGAAGEAINVVTTQESSPTWVNDLAPALVAVARKRATGIFHLTNEGHATRYEWARATLEAADLDPDLVHGVDHVAAAARRPRYSALTNLRARRLGITLEPWRDALNRYLRPEEPIQVLQEA